MSSSVCADHAGKLLLKVRQLLWFEVHLLSRTEAMCRGVMLETQISVVELFSFTSSFHIQLAALCFLYS